MEAQSSPEKKKKNSFEYKSFGKSYKAPVLDFPQELFLLILACQLFWLTRLKGFVVHTFLCI